MPQMWQEELFCKRLLVKDISSFISDEKEVSSDDNEVTEFKALMALADEERVYVGKESTRNGEWIKPSMKKVHTLLEMEDNDDRKSFLDYLCIDLNYKAKLDLLTMHHVNTEILKKNQNLRNELNKLTSITEAWLNCSNKDNQCMSEQIPTQKKKILGINQLIEDTSSSGPKDPVFVKSLADNSKVSITSSNKPKLSKAEDFTLSNHDTGKHPLPPLEKLTGAEPVSGPKTIKSILNSKSTFKAETLKALAGKLKNVKMEDDPPLTIVMKELNELKLQISKNKSSYFRIKNSQQQCSSTSDHNDIEWFRKREALQAKKVESFKASKTESSSALRSKTPTKRSPNMYKEYVAEFWYSANALENSKVSFSIPTGCIYGEVGVNTFRNAIGAHYLHHSSEYVAPPSIDVVRHWFPTIGYGEEVSAKGTLKKILYPPRWRLLMAQIIQCLGAKTGGFDQITNKGAIILYSLANGINIDNANIF
ncbi:hypothetical protein Tco_0262140 [Tanacetum coccineum]